MKERINKIIEKSGLNPNDFANLIEINRQTFLATLKRNNTVSTPIITSILNQFPEINAEWLLLGTEPMYKDERDFFQAEKQTNALPDLFAENPTNQDNLAEASKYRKEFGVKTPEKSTKQTKNQEITSNKSEYKKIEKIIIFYTDNTFTTLTPDE